MRMHETMETIADTTCGNILSTCGIKTLAFGCQDHTDPDKFRKKEKMLLLLKAKTLEQQKTILLKNSGSPTTCGYQFVYENRTSESKDSVYSGEQFFVMGGLGLAVEIQDGMCHRFLGSVFNHASSICIGYRRDSLVTIRRRNNSFFIYAWGKGKKKT